MTDPVDPIELIIIEESDEYLAGIVTDAADSPIDLTLTDTELAFTVRKRYGDTSSIVDYSIGSGITVAADGSYTVTVPSTATALLPGTYYYSLRYTSPASIITEVARGKLIVQPSAAVT